LVVWGGYKPRVTRQQSPQPGGEGVQRGREGGEEKKKVRTGQKRERLATPSFVPATTDKTEGNKNQWKKSKK